MTIADDSFKTRKVGGEQFTFLRVDSADKWEAAADFRKTFRLKIPGTDEVLKIPMVGLSYDQYNEVLAKHPYPAWEEDAEPTEAIKSAQALAKNRRRIDLLELAMGMPIPGASYEEKQGNLNQTNPGNLDVIEGFIVGELSNAAMQQGIQLANYNHLKSRFPEENETEIKSFESLFAATNSVIHFLRMNRSDQDYITEFPLKTLSQEAKEEIEKRCVEPQPPLIQVFHQVTRRPVPGKSRQNFDDPSYIRSLNRYMKQRTLMYLNACLPFRIPGENEDEQMKWIGSRLVGDVRQINNFINDVILGVEGRYSFFTNV